MLALSLQQPFASLVVYGQKVYVVRDEPTEHRGEVAIHAADASSEPASWRPEQEQFFSEARDRCVVNGMTTDDEILFPENVVMGVAELVDCVPTETIQAELEQSAPHELAFDDFSFSRYAWQFEIRERWPVRVPAVAGEGLWTWENV